MPTPQKTNKDVSALTGIFTEGYENDIWVKRLKVAGTITGAMALVGISGGMARPDWLWIGLIGIIGFFGSFLVMVAAASRAHGLRRGTTHFGRQILFVMGRTFLFILLPCAVITAIIFTIVWFTRLN